MAGTLFITDSLCWAPAGWVFDNVLESLAANLAVDDPSLSETLLNARTEIGAGCLDMRGYHLEDIKRLITAADKALESFQNRGPGAFYDPLFFQGFITQFKALRKMMAEAYPQKKG